MKLRGWNHGGVIGVALVAVLACAGRAAVNDPNPFIHDEFTYLLSADTLAHGRLTNPTHPLWPHFETFHVIHQPTYSSSYSLGQGVALAIGQVVFGHPLFGVWLSVALACGALCWMLQAWLPPRWAVVGGLLAAVHPLIISWGHSYWGGAVAMLGGALVYGAAPRALRRPHLLSSVLLGVGLVVLAHSRPFEGLVASLPVAVWMLWRLLRQGRFKVWETWTRLVAPVAIVLVVGLVALCLHHARVTGSAFQFPQHAYHEQYESTGTFWWQAPPPTPGYRNEALEVFWQKERAQYEQARAAPLRQRAVHVWKLAWPMAGWLIFPALLALFRLHRSRRSRLAAGALGLALIATAQSNWAWPHYAAPAICLVFVLAVQGLRILRLVGTRRPSQVRRFAIAGLVALYGSVSMAQNLRPTEEPNEYVAFGAKRAALVERLEATPGLDLVVVRYVSEHNTDLEWVHNDADIEGAEIVWARELGTDSDAALRSHFRARRQWQLHVEKDDVELRPLPPSQEAEGQ